jgi:hypothetical protein
MYFSFVLPIGRKIYSVFIFFFGYGGPYVERRISIFFQGFTLAS